MVARLTFAVLLATGAVLHGAPDGDRCEALARLPIPHTTISFARTVAAGAFSPAAARGAAANFYASLPAFCRVAAIARPTADSEINIEIWLPSAGWNRKYQAVGQGGLAGYIPYSEMAQALAAGYTTAGTDTGHTGDQADFVLQHPERLVDFAYRSIHEMADAGKRVVRAYYEAAPERSYFNGCSGGGRHGLTSAQRYPTDFDGIVAGASTWNQPRMDAARMAINRIVNRTAESGIPPGKFPMIANAVLAACDGLDGVNDGVIENPTRCRYDYASLLCKGADNPECLTAPQVESAKALVSPLMHPVTGKVLFEGHLWPGAEPEWARLSRPEPLDNVLTRVQNITFRDPHWEPSQFNIATDVDRADTIDKGLLASSNFNLKPFFDRGGKLLMWHGWSDPQVTPQNSIIYYNSVLKTVGSGADQSIALFMLPGVSHCQGGPGPDTFDKMGAMEQWVEHGRRPTSLIAAHMTRGKVDRTRPLCLYGQVARWNGKGSTDDAASFSCVAESMETSAR